MELAGTTLTVFFEDPFWVGIWERSESGTYAVSRVVFGAEPSDAQVYDLILTRWNRLRFSPAHPAEEAAARRLNPKRMQRLAQRQLHENGVGTKAQQALKLQQEQGKQARQRASRAQREAEAERRFALRQEKRREKRRGH